jgi:hypothetical protein
MAAPSVMWLVDLKMTDVDYNPRRSGVVSAEEKR